MSTVFTQRPFDRSLLREASGPSASRPAWRASGSSASTALRYLILSDIHANIVALESVLSDAQGEYDEIVNCGDLVGYGAEPNEVVGWCRAHTPMVVRGNHDKACVGLQDLEWFNPDARASAVWTNQELTEENRDFLRSLPKGPARSLIFRFSRLPCGRGRVPHERI